MELQVFDPVVYSNAENMFLNAHLGEPTVVAMRQVPPGVNPNAVKPMLERINELQELEKHEKLPWCGLGPIKESIAIWIRENAKWANDHRRNKRAPRFPSMYSFDSKGRGHRGGPGSDAGQVRTYFGPAGERLPFAVDLIPSDVGEWLAPGFTEAPVAKGLVVDASTNRIECRVKVATGVCGHTESYKSESRNSYNLARGRMSRHLMKCTENVEGHRELHTEEFGE